MTSRLTEQPAADAKHAAATRRVLSGITPSGPLTLGNYLGALRRFAQTDPGTEAFYFVADLHALTTTHDPGRLRTLTTQTAALYLACGVDPESAVVFRQSDVPAHAELSYLLESTAYVGELSRMIQFKEKGDRPRTRASLLTYPCLMAADILLYDTDEVPVGGDQDQHVELARTLAARFNQLYGNTFVVPRLAKGAYAMRIRDLADPAAKMSKSAPDDAAGVIRLLDGPDVVARKVRRAVTDSEPQVSYHPETRPGVANLIEIVVALTGDDPVKVAGSVTTCRELKDLVTDLVVSDLTAVQTRYAQVSGESAELERVLATGAERAAAHAGRVLSRARHAIGLA